MPYDRWRFWPLHQCTNMFSISVDINQNSAIHIEVYKPVWYPFSVTIDPGLGVRNTSVRQAYNTNAIILCCHSSAVTGTLRKIHKNKTKNSQQFKNQTVQTYSYCRVQRELLVGLSRLGRSLDRR